MLESKWTSVLSFYDKYRINFVQLYFHRVSMVNRFVCPTTVPVFDSSIAPELPPKFCLSVEISRIANLIRTLSRRYLRKADRSRVLWSSVIREEYMATWITRLSHFYLGKTQCGTIPPRIFTDRARRLLHVNIVRILRCNGVTNNAVPFCFSRKAKACRSRCRGRFR